MSSNNTIERQWHKRRNELASCEKEIKECERQRISGKSVSR